MDIQAYFEEWSRCPGETVRMAISTSRKCNLSGSRSSPARQIGLTIVPSLLGRADEVIE